MDGTQYGFSPSFCAKTGADFLETPDFCGWLDESGNTFQAPKRISEPETCDREFSDCPESASFNRRGAEKSNLLLGIRQGDEKGRGRREETQP